MKKIFKTNEVKEFMADLTADAKNEESKNETLVFLSTDYNSLNFLKKIVFTKNDRFTISVGENFIMAEPHNDSSSCVTFLNESLESILLKF